MDITRIMVVEDESIIALNIRISLQKLGYEVACIASTGEEALERAAEVQPDLLLMDIRLRGGMDGVETAMHIGEILDVPVVYLTAFTDADTLERAKLSQPYGYLAKPFTTQELRTTIEMALHKHAMEKQLREREQWLSTTLQSIGDGVIASDAEGRILFMNPVAQLLTGWTESEAMERDMIDVLKLVDDRGGPLACHPLKVAQDTRSIVELPEGVSLVSRSGRIIPVEDSAAPITGPNGQLTGVVMVFRDATQRRAAEAAVREAGESSRRAWHEEMAKLAGGIAHDFNNKLTVIMGMSELIAERVEAQPDLLEMANEIKQVCADSITLTRRLLAFTMKGTSDRGISRDLNGVVRTLEKALRPLLGEPIVVKTELDPALEKIETDPAYLEQILVNLVLNARDAMPRGGSLVLGTALVQLNESPPSLAFPFVPGRYAVLRVVHTLNGNASKAKSPDSAIAGKTGSAMGPGMAAVYGIVKHNRGNLRIEAGAGRGACIFIYLPVSARERVEPAVAYS